MRWPLTLDEFIYELIELKLLKKNQMIIKKNNFMGQVNNILLYV